MPLTRDQFIAPFENGLWQSELRSLNELSPLEVAERASLIIPGVCKKWSSLCVPYITSEPDYETMDEENSEEWIYSVYGWMDQIYDTLPLQLPSTTVYRLQTADQQGVFSHGIGLRALVAPDSGCPQKDPSFYRVVQDLGKSLPLDYKKSWFFGCSTLEQMNQWLSGGNTEALRQHDIEIGVYEVNSQWCIHGHTQSVFQKERAHLSDRLGLNEMESVSRQRLKL